MENKGFRWLLEILTHAKVTLPVLDTFLIRKSQVDSWIITDSKGKLNRKQSNNVSHTLSALDLIHYEYLEASKLRQRGSDIAYVYTREGRLVLSQSTLEEFKLRPLQNTSIFCVQRVKPHIGDCSKIYRLKLEYSNKEYKAEFYLSNTPLKVKNREWFQEVKDMATTILSAILEHSGKIVVHMELDFMKDERNSFWLAYIWVCKLVPWEIFKEKNFNTKEEILASEMKLDVGRKIKRTDIAAIKNIKKKLYQFRVRTPEDSDDSDEDKDEAGWSNMKKNSRVKLLGSAILSGVLSMENRPEHREYRKKLSLPGQSSAGLLAQLLRGKSGSTYDAPRKINPHFLEIICKTRAKMKIKEGRALGLKLEEDKEIAKEKAQILKDINEEEKKTPPDISPKKLALFTQLWKKTDSPQKPCSEKNSPKSSHNPLKLDFKTLSAEVTKNLSSPKQPKAKTARTKKRKKITSKMQIPDIKKSMTPIPVKSSYPSLLFSPHMNSTTLTPILLSPRPLTNPSMYYSSMFNLKK